MEEEEKIEKNEIIHNNRDKKVKDMTAEERNIYNKERNERQNKKNQENKKKTSKHAIKYDPETFNYVGDIGEMNIEC